MPINPKEILDRPDDVEYLRDFIETSNTPTTATINMTRVASEIHLARTIKVAGDRMESVINSMTESLRKALADHAGALVQSAKASERHASSLKCATWALVGATVALAVVAGLQVYLTVR